MPMILGRRRLVPRPRKHTPPVLAPLSRTPVAFNVCVDRRCPQAVAPPSQRNEPETPLGRKGAGAPTRA